MTRKLQELQARLEEAEELLRAIRSGEVDALVMSGPDGEQIYTLSGAEHPYRVMVEAMSEGAIMLTADGTIYYSNRSFAAMLETPLDQVIGSAMNRFVVADDEWRYQTMIRQASTGASRGEIRLKPAGGSRLPVYLSFSSFAAGASPSLCAVVTDLTEHKLHQELIAAEALERTSRAEAEASQRRITSILESITDSFFSVDYDWRVIDVNQRAAENLGKSREELVGHLLWDASPKGKVPELDAQYRRAMVDRVAVHCETRSAAAPQKWFERHIYPVEDGMAVYFRDITERRAAEEKLRRSEAHLAEAQRIGHVGSWIWQVATGELFWSLEHFRLFGVDPKTFRPTKENTQRLIHPEDLPAVEQTLEESIRNRSEFEVDYRLIRPDGSMRHHRGLGHPIVTESGDLELIGMVVDVTERKKAEESLRASEERFRRYFDLGLVGIAITSPLTGYLEVNDELCRILGYDREELLRMTWLEMTHPDDLTADVTQLNRVMTGEIDGYSMDKRWIRKDGHIVHSIMAAKCVRRRDGSVDFLVGLVQDITNRTLAENKLRRSEALLAEGQRISQTGSWVLNVATGELSWSAEHYRIWGVDPASVALTLETTRRFIHPEDRDAATDALDIALRERSRLEREFRIIRPDGVTRQVVSIGHPVFNETGRFVEYVGTVMDVTDRKGEEAARDELRRRLIAAQEEERRRIALEMHDEFGQLLSALVLKLSGLKRDIGRRVGFADQLESLEAIAKQLDRDLEQIVGRLRPTALDDLGLVAALGHYAKHWSEHFQIRVELHVTGMESGRLTNELDTALYRIIQEALNNVAKHAKATCVTILLDQRSERVSVIIEDDGVGFEAEQPDSTRQRFGLIGMRERATLLGGTLDIESHPGKGTTVVARIPLTPGPEQSRP